MPSADRRSFMRAASLWDAAATAHRSSRSTSSRSAEWARGTISACPRVAGAMSMNASVRSSSSTTEDGRSPAMILQKMQSGSDIGHREPIASALSDFGSTAARVLERVLARVHLARILRLGDLLQERADDGPAGEPQLERELVPANERRRGSLAAPAQSVLEQAAREREVRFDRRLRALAARGQAVGHREQRDIDLDGLTRAQVLIDRAPRERLRSVDEEAEPQVMAHERRNVRLQAP